jgi:3D (Asp-Asp-Asp) domain-containing protein
LFTLLARTLGGFAVIAVVARQSAATEAHSAPVTPAAQSVAIVIEAQSMPEADETCAPPIILTPDSYRRTFRVTAYCDRGITAAGIESGYGQCAAPADIPFGTKIYVPELGQTFVVTDRTHKRFRHNTVDIFMPDREDCLKFGRNYLQCEVTLPEETVKYGSPTLAGLIAERDS